VSENQDFDLTAAYWIYTLKSQRVGAMVTFWDDVTGGKR
jgi:hypothetical protein